MAELIHTKVGEAFEIPLKATPTAGFRWELSPPTEAADSVDVVSTEWQQMQPRLIGGSATQVFRSPRWPLANSLWSLNTDDHGRFARGSDRPSRCG